MKNATQKHDTSDRNTELEQCEVRDWCDIPAPAHTGQHRGAADVQDITATGFRSAFRKTDEGTIVPEVYVDLVEQTEPTGVRDLMKVHLALFDALEEKALAVDLTLHEADLLRRHLTQLLRTAGVSREMLS